MTILNIIVKHKEKIDSLDIELIISHILKKPREFVLAHPETKLNPKQFARCENFIKRRQKHEPLAYILGKKEFYGLDFKVTPDTLVPRPETEILVDEALQLVRNILRKTLRAKTAFIDIGTGSGNIAVSVAKNIKNNNIKFYATDISPKALRVAKFNAKKNKVGEKIKFIESDLLDCFLKNNSTIGRFNSLIFVANLPYLDLNWKNLLTSSDTKGLRYEPDTALYAGEDGLDAYRKLAGQIKKLKVSANGKKIFLLCEIGHLQKKPMEKIFSFSRKTSFKKDLAGYFRVFTAEIN